MRASLSDVPRRNGSDENGYAASGGARAANGTPRQQLAGGRGHAHARLAQDDDVAGLDPDSPRPGGHVDEAAAAEDARAVFAAIVADAMMP